MAYFKQNTASAGLSGTAITTSGQTGGGSGDALSPVAAAGYPAFSNAFTQLGNMSYLFDATESANPSLIWSHIYSTDAYSRAYVYWDGTFPAGIHYFTSHRVGSVARSYTMLTAAGKFAVWMVGIVTTSTMTAAPSTWYRIEMHTVVSPVAGTAVMQIYDASGTLLETVTSANVTANTSGLDSIDYGVVIAHVAVSGFYMTNLAASDQGWIGPYVPPDPHRLAAFLVLMDTA